MSLAPVRLEFTAAGSEYFRIWIVNLSLTLMTLGIYSAWAKVRKTRYFWENTRLAGFAFDYHGSPRAILRGRLAAVVLLVLYNYAFSFSKAGGVATGVLLCIAGPWLLLKAQQFKLANTSWRGLRFGFRARPAAAYRCALPALILWSSAWVSFNYAQFRAWFWLVLAVGLCIPWLHHGLKAFQHGHATYGDRAFSFEPARLDFYLLYAKGFVLVLVGAIASMMLCFFVVAGMLRSRDPTQLRIELEQIFATWQAVVAGQLVGLLAYLLVWPYFAARLQQVVWDRTIAPGLRFRTEIRPWPLFKVLSANVALTILTAGLYWPFAAVAIARYRIQCMTVASALPLDAFASGVERVPASASGDGAADLFGLDIGL